MGRVRKSLVMLEGRRDSTLAEKIFIKTGRKRGRKMGEENK